MLNRDTWYPAMTEEILGLETRGCWTLVDCPLDAQISDRMWVFNVKLDGNGVVIKPKAHYVCHGNMQIAGQDYEKGWSMVARVESV